MTRLNPVEILLLDHAASVQDVSVAYGLAKAYDRTHDASDIAESVQHALLTLFDLGFIAFFRSSRARGYQLTVDEVEPMTREEVIHELQLPLDFVADEQDLAFFVETEAGRNFFFNLPRDAVPEIE